MYSVVTNPNQFNRGLNLSLKRFEKRFRNTMRLLVNAAMVRLLRRTPVNTGQAVMNYVASAGTPYSGPPKTTGGPVEQTNKLALGAEQLRGKATAVSMATLGTLNFANPFQTFWIVNRSPNIGGLEAGELPKTPFTPRSPQGMFGVTLQEITALLEGGRFR